MAKFDPSKPHCHRCPKCSNYAVYCSAKPCPHPEWAECADCAGGWKLGWYEGELVRTKEVPLRVRVERDFP